ncbi:SsgA family sporulation/cell division regulator [Streptomyces albidus (ex Kaewkla and Franco 2022)]|uniref:SsgA family sporulation/cell division regulator n=1 Tax=Streptomyces albidus (ex Kaewkla and Franco 2022) TaxID=722709 RepID=UPI0015EE5992|nr:SsgA family sporulation/cell division regulator [Streptomyces albidus (ex Kaewkla and Franco 2022)]
MQILVECELEIRLVLSPDRNLPVPARLTYRADDPYAAHIAFHVGQGASVTWTFARELLVEGVFRACGEGDVRVWPAKVQGRDILCVALSSPDGDALLEMPSSVVSGWLERTLRAVPPGLESEVLGMDKALRDLLEAAQGDDLCVRDPSPSDESGDGGGVLP